MEYWWASLGLFTKWIIVNVRFHLRVSFTIFVQHILRNFVLQWETKNLKIDSEQGFYFFLAEFNSDVKIKRLIKQTNIWTYL